VLTLDLQNGTLITGGGSGTSTPGYVVSPFEAIQKRLIENQGIVRWDFASINPPIYANSEACLVFINGKSSIVVIITATS
jgi:beta-glucosidase